MCIGEADMNERLTTALNYPPLHQKSDTTQGHTESGQSMHIVFYLTEDVPVVIV